MASLNPTMAKIKEKIYVKSELGVQYANLDARLTKDEVSYLEKAHSIRTDVHRQCINCQARQVVKFWDVEHRKYKGRKFYVPCKFVPRGYGRSAQKVIDTLIGHGMSERKARLVSAAGADPVAWARLQFNFTLDTDTFEGAEKWRLRPYQKDQLRCSAQRLVLRQGRRCVSGSTMVLMANGLRKRIDRVRKGDMVGTQWGPKKVTRVYENGHQTLYSVFTSQGRVIEVTENHPFWVKRPVSDSLMPASVDPDDEGEWRSIVTGMTVGDEVAIASTKVGEVEMGWDKVMKIDISPYRPHV